MSWRRLRLECVSETLRESAAPEGLGIGFAGRRGFLSRNAPASWRISFTRGALASLGSALIWGAVACDEPRTADAPGRSLGSPTVGANPAVVPAPLADAPLGSPAALDGQESANTKAPGDGLALAPPRLLRPHHAPPPQRTAHRGEAISIALDAHFTWPGRDPKPAFHGLAGDELDAAKLACSRKMGIELEAGGTMRLRLTGGGFPLPTGTELLARHDFYGHLLVWPKATRYRVLPLGSAAAVLQERRVDVAPLVTPTVTKEHKPKERRFGFEIEHVDLKTERGTLGFEFLVLPEADAAGVPLCRLLLELAGAPPSHKLCSPSRLPARAAYHFANGAKLDFVVDTLKLRTETITPLEVPPRSARFTSRELPAKDPMLLDEQQLDALWRGTEMGELELVNDGLVGAYVLLDNTPVAFLPSKTSHKFRSLRRAEMVVELRDFFGHELFRTTTKIEAATRVEYHSPALRDGGTE